MAMEYTFRIYILLHIKKHNFIRFFYLVLKSLKDFTVSRIRVIENWMKVLDKK